MRVMRVMDKLHKYDRQLRLWASSGQNSLENSHICLINATATSAEILKNLILPGIGDFTIIDSNIISEEHLAGNFFLTKDDIGKKKAHAMCERLGELNVDSKGHALLRIPDLDDSIWATFTLVIVSDYIDLQTLENLKQFLFNKNIPLLVTNIVGFYGTLNLIANEVTIIETHSSSKLYDLRIDQPWPELLDYANSFEINALDDTDHAHVPYVIIFIKVLQLWKSRHNNNPPLNYTEKNQFKALVESFSRNINFETNFIEASNSIHRALRKTEIPNYLLQLFQHDRLKSLNKDSLFFWILINALKNFIKKFNQLPLLGTLPDMASDTINYITLQTIYKEKALKDKKLFIAETTNLLCDIGRTDPLTPTELDIINIFVKNCHFLHVANGSTNWTSPELLNYLVKNNQEHDTENYSLLGIYHGILTFNRFVHLYGKGPGINDLEGFIQVFIEEFQITSLPNSVLETFKEICCHNSTNYHNTSSFIGGVAAQEALKLITSQYVPLDNVFIFDGIRSMSIKYKV